MKRRLPGILDLLKMDRDPAAPFAADKSRVYTWQDFLEMTRGLCSELAADNTQEWILYCHSPAVFAIGLAALLNANKTVILPQNIQTGTLEDMNIANVKILTDRPVRKSPYTTLVLDIDNISRIPYECTQIDPVKPALKIYTSGSTGRPKQVTKTLAQLEAELQELEKVWGNAAGDSVFLSTVVHQHLYGLLFSVLWPVCRGSIISSNIITIPEELTAINSAAKSVVLVTSPAFLRRLSDLELKREMLKIPFIAFSSGGALEKGAADAANVLFGKYPAEVLGSTETGGVAYRTQENGNEAWTPFDVVDTDVDPDGQLLVRSPYLDSPGFFPMGDRVEFLQGGRSFLLKERLDKVVKIEEKRISLTEIEARLNESPLVSQSAAIKITGKRQSIGVAVVLSKEGKEQLSGASTRSLNEALRLHLHQYFEPVVLPRKWRYVDVIPVNSQGKTTLSGLAALFAGETKTEDEA